MKPTLYGFIDLHYGILLIDNINLTSLMKCKNAIETDKYGRYRVRKINDETYRTYIQLGTPNTTYTPWHLPASKSKKGIEINRLYNNTIGNGKYKTVNTKEIGFFTATTTFEIPERRNNARKQKRYDRILNTHKLMLKPL